VEEIRAAAEQQYRKEELRLEEKLTQAQARINQLQAQEGTGESGGVVLSPQTRAEITKFREEVVSTRKELRAVRLNLDRDIEKLGTTLRWINIAAMPLGVIGAALVVALVRSRRRGRRA
jgi:hypothetical protein